MICEDCNGSRAVPDIFGDLVACPSCVVEASDGACWVVWEPEQGYTRLS